MGIEAVYQEKALADQQALWRNVFMGREIATRLGVLDIRRMREETRRLMVERMGFTSAITPETMVRTMSGGERQGVAIVRALYFQAELIILDEPTMGLSVSETQKALDFIRGIKTAGKSCIFIDHNVFHVYPVVDRIVILDRCPVPGEFLRHLPGVYVHDAVLCGDGPPAHPAGNRRRNRPVVSVRDGLRDDGLFLYPRVQG